MAFVRKSKFRHVFGQSAKKESSYEGFRVTNCRFEGSFIAANGKWIAFCVENEAGGAFAVIPVERKGRLNKGLMNVEIPKIIAHKKYVLDMQWNPYDDDMIATCSEDGCIRIWEIPDTGVTKNWHDDKALVTLDYHERRCVQVQWHPIASNVLMSVSAEPKICIWNLDEGAVEVEIFNHPDIIWNASWSNRGTQIVTSCRDRKFRIFDARSGVLMLWGSGHEGSRGQRVIFTMNDKYLLSCGFSSTNERQLCLWKAEDLAELNMVQLDNASGCLVPYYDADTSMVYLAAKGDSGIRYYELVDEEPYIHFISTLQSTTAQRGLACIPKRSVNVNDNELMKFYKLHGSQSGFIEPISMLVPRSSDIFHYDLYPDAIGLEPGLDAGEWFQGKNCAAKRIDMSSKYAKTKKILCTGGLKNKGKSLKESRDGSKSGSFDKPDDRRTPGVFSTPREAKRSSPPSSPGGTISVDATIISELEEEIYVLRRKEAEKDEKIQKLLEQVHSYENAISNIREMCDELMSERRGRRGKECEPTKTTKTEGNGRTEVELQDFTQSDLKLKKTVEESKGEDATASIGVDVVVDSSDKSNQREKGEAIETQDPINAENEAEGVIFAEGSDDGINDNMKDVENRKIDTNKADDATEDSDEEENLSKNTENNKGCISTDNNSDGQGNGTGVEMGNGGRRKISRQESAEVQREIQTRHGRNKDVCSSLENPGINEDLSYDVVQSKESDEETLAESDELGLTANHEGKNQDML